jgi:SAM-dependent methyltransferase
MAAEKAELYNRHHEEYQEDIDFWLGLAEVHGDPVLELGCGTGRVLSRLAEAGHKAWGLDKDEEMLEVLRSNTAGMDLPEDVIHHADMTDFKLPMTFSLIILPCNTYSTLTGAERFSTLQAVDLHLSPGGTFAASMPNPARLAEMPEEAEAEVETTFIHPGSGNPVQVSNAWNRVGDGVLVKWYYDHLLPDGRVLRSTAEVRHTLTSMKAYLGEFIQMGWNTRTYGDFESRPYEHDSTYLILVGRKEGK